MPAIKAKYFIFQNLEAAINAKQAWWKEELRTKGTMETVILDEYAQGHSQLSVTNRDDEVKRLALETAFEDFLDTHFAGTFVMSKTPRVNASIETLFRNTAPVR